LTAEQISNGYFLFGLKEQVNSWKRHKIAQICSQYMEKISLNIPGFTTDVYFEQIINSISVGNT